MLRKTSSRVAAFVAAATVAILVVIAAVPAVAAPAVQLQDDNGGSSLCLNRAGGGTSIGTHVIGWSCGDNNNDFEWVALGHECGHGYVTQTCPFAVGSGLNLSYQGDQIVMVLSPSANKCLGGSSSTDFNGSLQACPDDYGNDGGWSTVNILEYSRDTNGLSYYVMINRNWSDWYVTHSNPACSAFACTLVDSLFGGKGAQVTMNAGDAQVRGGNPAGAAYYNVFNEL